VFEIWGAEAVAQIRILNTLMMLLNYYKTTKKIYLATT